MKAKVCLYGDADLLYKCFEPEILKKERSSYTLKKNKDNLEFNIEASDEVALKTALNSIFKLFIVYEKLEGIKNG